MSAVKKTLLKHGMRLMSDPRVLKLMQDERVMRALMAAMSMPAKAQTFAKEQVETIAKSMALATEGEVKDLQRTVRKLEEELARIQAQQAPGNGGANRKSGTAE
jgi:hypothetical protein